MKILFVSFYMTFPPVCGAAVVSMNTARFINGRKIFFQLGEKTEKRKLKDGTILISQRLHSAGYLVKIMTIIKCIPKIIFIIKKQKPDYIILEGAAWTFYYYCLVRMMKLMGIKSHVVYHSHNVDYVLRYQKDAKVVAILTKWAEFRLLRSVEIVTAVSERDAKQFKELYQVDSLVFPNGVDVLAFKAISNEDISQIKKKYGLTGNLILFMGLPDYPPNREGLRFLIDKVMPALLVKKKDFKLVVIGGELKEKKSWINNPGSVPYEDVPKIVKACDICVAPIFSGSGTRLKILEYMAAEKPVVSTKKGAEGLDIINGKEIYIADTENSFVQMILHLFSHPEAALSAAINGRKMVESKYDWRIITKHFENLLCKNLDRSIN